MSVNPKLDRSAGFFQIVKGRKRNGYLVSHATNIQNNRGCLLREQGTGKMCNHRVERSRLKNRFSEATSNSDCSLWPFVRQREAALWIRIGTSGALTGYVFPKGLSYKCQVGAIIT